jgi:hypothetical protein
MGSLGSKITRIIYRPLVALFIKTSKIQRTGFG